MIRIINAKDIANVQKNRLFRRIVGRDAAETQEKSRFSICFEEETIAEPHESSLFCMRFITGMAVDAQDIIFLYTRFVKDTTTEIHEKTLFCMRVAKDTTGVQENVLFCDRLSR